MLDFIANFISQIDWSSFFPSLIATGIGCRIAIVLTQRYDTKKITDEESILKDNILFELAKIKEQIQLIEKNKQSDEEIFYYLSPIKTPFYDALVSTYKFEILMQHDWFYTKDKDKKSALMVYETVIEYNKWHTWRTDSKGDIPKEQLAEQHLTNLSEDIYLGIDYVLSDSTQRS